MKRMMMGVAMVVGVLGVGVLRGAEVVGLDEGWRFMRGEVALGASWGLKGEEGWRVVDVPHDWAIEGPIEEKAATGGAGAFVPSGVAWYRRRFVVPALAKGKRVVLEFDGVMAHGEVYVNGALVAARPNGYVPIDVDVTANVVEGENLVAVRTDTSRQPASRFYAGAGIYRHVRMVVEEAVHVVRGETVWTTKRVEGERAVVHVRAVVANEGEKGVKVQVGATARLSGKPSGLAVTPLQEIAAGGREVVELDMDIGHAQVWEGDLPVLYSGEVKVLSEGLPTPPEAAGVVGVGGGGGGDGGGDVERTNFGIRVAEFRAGTGFWLNGKNIKLKGVALHSDMGALGMAVPASAWESRLVALKKLGVNAVRTAHNPPSVEFLEVCDRLGLMVMDEVFDAWSVGKTAGDYHVDFGEWGERDLAAVVRRDRNHPSVVVWSVGNEIWDLLPQNPDPAPDQFVGPKRGVALGREEFLKLREVVHREDPTRPVTMALLRANVMGLYDNGFGELMDVVGQNYRDGELAAAGVKHPSWKLLGTEDYKTRETWMALRDNPALAGQFVWAGADYLGESGRWPNVVSGAGLMDRTNEVKGEGLEREAWWAEHPVVHVVRVVERAGRAGGKAVRVGVRDWTPLKSEAHEETVAVYSNLGRVELLLNGKSLGSKARDAGDKAREWVVPFQAGTLKAVGKDGEGKEVSEEMKTAGAAAKVRLTAERGTLAAGWEEVDYVRAEVVDAGGVRVPSAEVVVKFSVEGPGKVVGVDNAALADHDSFQGSERRTTRGSCVAIVRGTGDSGEIVLTGASEGLESGHASIAVLPASTGGR